MGDTVTVLTAQRFHHGRWHVIAARRWWRRSAVCFPAIIECAPCEPDGSYPGDAAFVPVDAAYLRQLEEADPQLARDLLAAAAHADVALR